MVGNSDHMNIRLGKAGRKRWLGRRPHVRGVAMNPVDHPMGGGEGRTSGGRHPVLAHRQAGQGRQDPPPSQAVEQGDHPPPQERPVRTVEGLGRGPAWPRPGSSGPASRLATHFEIDRRVSSHGTDTIMGRSLKKGPYVVERLLEKVDPGRRSRAAASRSRPGPGRARSCPSSSARTSRSTTARPSSSCT